MKIVLVILQYGGVVHTLECLESLRPQLKASEAEVVIVDNASPQGFHELYTSLGKPALLRLSAEARFYTPYDGLHLIRANQNLGYGAGNNLGAAYAFECLDADFVWVLNNDTRLAPDALAEFLVYVSQHPDKAMIGHTIVDYGKETVQTLGGAKYNPLLAFGKRVLEGKNYRNLQVTEEEVLNQIDYMTGASFAIRRQAYERVGLFDPRYFLYFEEIDLAKRMRRAGLSLGWAGKVIVEHKEGASISPDQRSVLSEYHATLSALLVTQKHFPRMLPVTATIRLIYKILYYIKLRKVNLIRAHFAGIRAFMRRKS